jgi:hypothetical protein
VPGLRAACTGDEYREHLPREHSLTATGMWSCPVTGWFYRPPAAWLEVFREESA